MKPREYDATSEYMGVTIGYKADTDKWYFELDGKERSAKTLANARAAVDAPAPKEKKPFERILAYKKEHWKEGMEKVTITSVAERGRYSSDTSAWVTDSKGNREKVAVSKLFEFSPFNDSVFDTIKRLNQEIKTLNILVDKEQKKLIHPVLPEPSDEA